MIYQSEGIKKTMSEVFKRGHSEQECQKRKGEAARHHLSIFQAADNMETKYDTLTLVQLREIVKKLGIKNTSGMRKAELVKILCDVEAQQNMHSDEEAQVQKQESEQSQADHGDAEEHPVRSERVEHPIRVVRTERSSRYEQGGRQNQGNRYEQNGRQEQNSRYEQNGRYGQDNRQEQGSRYEQNTRQNRQDQYERQQRVSRYEQPDRQERQIRETSYDRPVRTEQYERQDRPVRAEQQYERQDRPVRAEQQYERQDRPVRTEMQYEQRPVHTEQTNTSDAPNYTEQKPKNLEELDSGKMASGILEVMSEGFGFIRCANYLPGDNDVYVSPAQIRRFNLKTGDIVEGNMKIKSATEKFSALLYVQRVNGLPPAEAAKRINFEDMVPIFPNERIRLENPKTTIPMRIVDLVSPIGKGQRGMIVSPPKTGKTTLLKQIAKSINYNYPEMNMIILLIDERPEEVTDIKEYIEGENVEVIYSTFDELPEHHKRVSEMVLERAKRLVEHRKDVVILLDSITRLARAYNLTVPPSGRTLSGGLDPAALHMPKKFFGAARNMRGGGSLTVLATALVETGSKMDDVVFEEFKGTGNMELVLDRKLSEKRIFPAIDIPKSGTRREELLLDRDEMEAMYHMRKALNGMKSDEALEHILDMFMRTRTNKEFIANIKRTKII